MTTEKIALDITEQVTSILAKEPGMTVKGLAAALKVNRQFMAGFLLALEERGQIFHRQVGPARIYFLRNS